MIQGQDTASSMNAIHGILTLLMGGSRAPERGVPNIHGGLPPVVL
jgi:hypothetical protein